MEETVQVPSATVKIKGYSGAEHTYENVPKVWLAAPESTAENPVLVPFTYGEALDNVELIPDFSGGDQKITMPNGYMARSAVVKKPAELVPGNIKAGETVAGITGEYEGEAPETEEKTVAADFSGGDMVLEPTAGKYLSKATVEKPETLIPENIAEGVNVAGIVGTLTGGSNVQLATGKFTGGSSDITVTHGMGVVPDIVMIVTTRSYSANTTNTKTFRDSGIHISSKLRDALVEKGMTNSICGLVVFRVSGNKNAQYSTANTTLESAGTASGMIYGANETTFKVVPTDATAYEWIAIAGLV